MSEKSNVVIIAVVKYIFLNLAVFFFYVYMAGTLNMLFNSLLIANCTAIIMGKLQKIEDRISVISNKEDSIS